MLSDDQQQDLNARASCACVPVAVALLGRRDEPTDALEDYCGRLAQALRRRGFSLEISRIPWAEQGWLGGLKDANKQFDHMRGRWALVQYTALAWSRRGFP